MSNHDAVLQQLIDTPYLAKVRTPTATTSSSSFFSTPSSSSKKKNWASKLSKFQLSSNKKKRSISPQLHIDLTPRTSDSTHSFYPSRNDSLPRPESAIFTPKHNHIYAPTPTLPSSSTLGSMNGIPKVKPFEFQNSRKPEKKSFLKTACTLCDEPISNRTNGERVIELQCDHIIHQECLKISFGSTDNFDTSNIYSLFPYCTKCTSHTARAIPKNSEIKDTLVSDFLLTETSSTAFSQPQIINELRSPLPSPIQELESKRLLLLSPASNSRTGSTIMGSSLIVSSADDNDSILSCESANSDSYDENVVPLPLLRSYFVEALVTSFPQYLSNWKCDDEFGLLRIVDSLMFSLDNTDTYSEGHCYLFERALILTKVKHENNDTSMLGAKMTDIHIFSPINFRIETLKSSTLKITLADSTTLFFSESNLSRTSSKTVEKWISALLDTDLFFDEKNFTSTLELPPVIQNLGYSVSSPTDSIDTNNGKETFLGMISPTKVIEVARVENHRNSTIIKRGFPVLNDNESSTNTMTTIQSMLTSVSSIISLKRGVPEQMALLLQLDVAKFKEEDYQIIFNTVIALTKEYSNLMYCAIDRDGYVLRHGNAAQDFESVNFVCKTIFATPTSIQFSPQWLADQWYPGGNIDSSLGIAIVSNGTMEDTKSCLFMNFDCFTSNNRRKPNELKVKIGYLNADYSEKINELVEVESWGLLLEALCYSFSINFEDLDDSDDYESESDLSSDVSDRESMTTLLVGTPIDSHSKSPFESTSNINDQWSEGWDPLLQDIEKAIEEINHGNQ